MYGIGRMSRESGLTVSALRFYDGAGLLRPAHVDPHSGYRCYDPGQVAVARVVAALRRAGMPLAGIRDVLAHRRDRDRVGTLVAAHVRDLEHGLDAARRALSTVPLLLEPLETAVPSSFAVPTADLTAALAAVRFAAGSDPDLPVLSTVLFDTHDGVLTLAATDRYRLATATVPVERPDGPPVAAPVPLGLADDIAAILPGGRTATVTVDGDAIAVRVGAASASGPLSPDAFPDFRRLLPAAVAGEPVDPDELRAAAPVRRSVREQDGVGYDVVEVSGVGVNREFLLQALDAGGPGPLLLALDGPVRPLVLRSERSTSLLMPVRPPEATVG